MTWLLLWLVRGYRFLIGPLLPPACRFYPSCSVYAEEVLRTHGWWRGGGMSIWRLLRCHPFHPGGWDPPLPAAKNAASPCNRIQDGTAS